MFVCRQTNRRPYLKLVSYGTGQSVVCWNGTGSLNGQSVVCWNGTGCFNGQSVVCWNGTGSLNGQSVVCWNGTGCFNGQSVVCWNGTGYLNGRSASIFTVGLRMLTRVVILWLLCCKCLKWGMQHLVTWRHFSRAGCCIVFVMTDKNLSVKREMLKGRDSWKCG